MRRRAPSARDGGATARRGEREAPFRAPLPIPFGGPPAGALPARREVHVAPRRAAARAGGAGQRAATLLVYLTTLGPDDGGATMFRDLAPPAAAADAAPAAAEHASAPPGAASCLRVRPTRGHRAALLPRGRRGCPPRRSTCARSTRAR